MKRIQYIFIATIVLSLAISCSSNYLDEKPYSYYNTGHTDDATVEAEIIGLHRIFAELWGWSSHQGFLSCWQLGTDVTTAGGTEGVELPFYQYADLNSENAAVAFLWQECYNFINASNLILSALGEDNNPAAQGEAKFFRAYAYNMLVTLWGDVPLLTEPVMTPKLDFTRQSVKEIDSLIESDLTYAIQNLPEVDQVANEGRIDKDIARQLLTEAYLRMGMRDNSYFAKAEQTASDIINSGHYALIQARYGKFLSNPGDYYNDMFLWGNQRRSQGNTEGIWTFEMEYNRDVAGGTIDNPQFRRVWAPGYYNIPGMAICDSLGGRGIGRMKLSNFMKYTVWSGLDGDIRNSNYNIRRYTNYNNSGWSSQIGIDANGMRVDPSDPTAVKVVTVQEGDLMIPSAGDTLAGNWAPYTTKWGCYDPTDQFGYATVKDWPVMRLGETYLLRAEARFRQGNNTGAADDINVLRDRAFKDARAASGNSNLGRVSESDINIDFILDERSRELIGEENRRMTLVRTGTLKERIDKNGSSEPGKTITGFQDFNSLLPIPLTEIQLNKDAVLEQNPGY